MSVKYKLFRDNKENSKYRGQWYARVYSTDTCTLKQISERIQRNCSMKASDVNAVLTEMVEVMRDELLAGHRVKIDGFGSFRVGISTKPAASVDKFKVNTNIKRAYINFLPATTTTQGHGRVKDLIAGITFKEYSAYNDNKGENKG